MRDHFKKQDWESKKCMNNTSSQQIRGAIIIEGHVQGLSNVRSLGEWGIPVYVVDKTDCIARYSKFCLKYFRCPDFKSDDFADFLISLAKTENIRDWLLLPSNDHAVLTLSKHLSRIKEYFKLTVQDFDIIRNIYDKYLLLKVAERNGISFPLTYHFNSINEINTTELQYPLITKGRAGLDFYKTLGKKALISGNLDEFSHHIKELSGGIDLKDTFTQEVIPFDRSFGTISFTAFCIDGDIKTFWMGEKLREHPLRFGTATFCKSTFVEDLIHPSSVLMKALGYSGVCEIEYLKDPRDGLFKLIEINARTWLWVGLARSAGVDFAKIAYNYVNGFDNEFPERYELDIKWSNRITDVFYSVKSIFSGKLALKEFLNSYKGNIVNAVFDIRDIKPGLIYLLFLFWFLKSR